MVKMYYDREKRLRKKIHNIDCENRMLKNQRFL